MKRLRRAAILAFVAHLVAGIAMAMVLIHGLETALFLQPRLAFLVEHRVLWTLGWLTWTVAAFTILYFYLAFAEVHSPPSQFAVLLTVVALAPDLSAQAIEIGVLPGLAAQLAGSNGTPELFLMLHRVAVMLSGFVANTLYSLTALLLAWSARRAYPSWVTATGIAVAIFGFSLSVAALLDSMAGMVWTNMFLVPAILLWLAAVAVIFPAGVSSPNSPKSKDDALSSL